jgi:hypothetical protein
MLKWFLNLFKPSRQERLSKVAGLLSCLRDLRQEDCLGENTWEKSQILLNKLQEFVDSVDGNDTADVQEFSLEESEDLVREYDAFLQEECEDQLYGVLAKYF